MSALGSDLKSDEIDKHKYLTGKNYYLVIKVEWKNKMSLLFLLYEKHWKNKQKNWSQGERQIKKIVEHTKQLAHTNASVDKNMFSKEK